MATTLNISTFNQILKGKSLDIKKAASDARLKKINFSKADLNKDGK